MATAINTQTHKTLIDKALKLGIDAEFYDSVEDLKAACREASSKSILTKLAELQIEEKKLSSPLYVAKALGSNFSADDFKSAEKFLDMESKFKQKEAEVRMTETYTAGMMSRLR